MSQHNSFASANPFSDENLKRVAVEQLPFSFEFPFDLSGDALLWAQRVSYLSSDFSLLKEGFNKAIQDAPSQEAAEYFRSKVLERLKKKVSQLDFLISNKIPVSEDLVSRLADVSEFTDLHQKLIGCISDENMSHPIVKKALHLK